MHITILMNLEHIKPNERSQSIKKKNMYDSNYMQHTIPKIGKCVEMVDEWLPKVDRVGGKCG